MSAIKFIDQVEIKNKRILLRVDFNISLSLDKKTIIDDTRIKETLPTINYLLKNGNRLIIIAHLGRPENRDSQYSLRIVSKRLQTYLPDYKIILVEDFLQSCPSPQPSEILLLENIRFYPEEKSRNPDFINRLASLGNIYVNDAFGVCHRQTVSVVDLPRRLPAYAGLLIKKEIAALTPIINNPKRPLVTIIGGAKISTKINLIRRLGQLSDQLLIGGAIANTFLAASGQDIGQSMYEPDQLDNAKQLEKEINQKNKKLILPFDFITDNDKICDIGPQSQKSFTAIIAQAKTIIWNGPVGLFEDSRFTTGSQAILEAIIANSKAYSVVGGGDTLAFLAGKPNLDKISHISTGGGALLEYIEKGTLPGIEVLKK